MKANPRNPFPLTMALAAVALNASVVVPARADFFLDTGAMRVARSAHTATLLPNGKVLACGGDANGTADLYDPITNTWTGTRPMFSPRAQHTATLLPNGKVLVAGGYDGI